MPAWGSWPGRRVLQEAVVESPPKDEGGSEESNLEAMLGSVMCTQCERQEEEAITQERRWILGSGSATGTRTS